MKQNLFVFVGLALYGFFATLVPVEAQGTAFTYQGRLSNAGTPVSGAYSLSFSLFTTLSNGVSSAGPVTNNGVLVNNGLFTVTIDFGAGVFTGTTNWLEIGVASNGENSFSTLAPRQQLMPVPYAMFAETASAAGLSGTIANGMLPASPSFSGNVTAGAFSGSGAALTSLNAASLTSGTVPLTQLPAGLVTNTQTDVTLNGTFSGTGTGLSINASQLVSIGNGNFFLGTAGNATTSGFGNTANGSAALQNNSSGYLNTASGLEALYYNTNGYGNTANGVETLLFNLSGYENTADGLYALSFNVNGNQNTAVGSQALYANASGSLNTAVGANSLVSNTNGQDNTAIGRNSLYSSTSGFNNIAVGDSAGYAISTGSQNIDIGNPGYATDNGIIRIGNSQSQIYLAGVINGNGSGLANLSAPALTGTIPNEALPASPDFSGTVSAGIFSGNGAGLTSLNASNLSGGTVPLAQLPAAVVTNTETGVILGGTFNGNGGGLTSLNGAQLVSIGNTNGGVGNSFIGNSGNSLTTGSNNAASGAHALINNFNGSYNVANGENALQNNTNGSYNTAVGSQALKDNTSGFNDSAEGYGALFQNTSGSNNVAIGLEALFQNTSGSGNIALGYLAGYYNANTGSNNIDIGNEGFATDNGVIRIGNGQTQTFITGVLYGNGAGLTSLNATNFSSGTLPVAQLPASVVTNNQTGVKLSGIFSGAVVATGLGLPLNTYVYAGGNPFLTSVDADLYIGQDAGFASTPSINSENTGIGFETLSAITGGTENTALGAYALSLNSSGTGNTAVGDDALLDNASGQYNTANGVGSLRENIVGSFNTATGDEALGGNDSGSNNVAVGASALGANFSGQENTAVGTEALLNNDGGSENVANGCRALFWNGNGNLNTADGYQALFYNTTGSNNTANGFEALYANKGSGNTAGGYSALFNITNGSYNIALGYLAGYAITAGSSNIDIGNQGASGDNNIIRIGTTQTTCYLAGNVSAMSFNVTSDRYAKENFSQVNSQDVLAKVSALPVSEWNFKTETKEVHHIGPMAQDFQAAFQLSPDPKHISLMDEGGVALAAIQGLNQKLEANDAIITKQAGQIQSLELQNDTLSKQLSALEAIVKALAAKN